MLSRRQLVQNWASELTRAAIDSPRLSAEVVLACVLGVSRLDVVVESSLLVPDEVEEEYTRLMHRRLAGEPVAYLTGRKEFYSLDFRVGPGVLIPRPETELMVEWLEKHVPSSRDLLLADVGTGSGILAVSAAITLPRARVIGCDISPIALEYAQANVQLHGVSDRVSLFRGSLLEAVHVNRIDIILANLPYVPEVMRAHISHEVLGFEPETALFAGEDGLECYRILAKMIAGQMRPDSVLLCELDCTQGAAFEALFAECCSSVQCYKDLAGLDRLGVVVF